LTVNGVAQATTASPTVLERAGRSPGTSAYNPHTRPLLLNSGQFSLGRPDARTDLDERKAMMWGSLRPYGIALDSAGELRRRNLHSRVVRIDDMNALIDELRHVGFRLGQFMNPSGIASFRRQDLCGHGNNS